MNIRKLAWIGAFLLAVPGCAFADCLSAPPDLTSPGKLTIATHLTTPPQGFLQDDKPAGFVIEIGEAIATRWIQTAKGVLLLQMVPGDDASGAIYVFDRRRDQWYMLSFEECEDRFTSERFDCAFSEYDLFRLAAQPGLLMSELQPANA